MFDIVIPTYKIRPDLISRCLESINDQVFKKHKVYLVDGTPSDWEHFKEFRSVVDSHAVVYLRQTGKGVSQARNQAVSQGTNPYASQMGRFAPGTGPGLATSFGLNLLSWGL